MSLGFYKKVFHPYDTKELLRTPNSQLRTCGVTRRLFLKWLLGLPFLFSSPFVVRQTLADPFVLPKIAGKSGLSEFLKEEEFVYEIGFWLFRRAALGKLKFTKMEKKGHYTATLQAETLGVLGWMSRYRIDTYRSEMEEIDEGRRLRSVSFEEDVKIGSKLRKRIHQFDYQKRKWIQFRRRKDGTMQQIELIVEDAFDMSKKLDLSKPIIKPFCVQTSSPSRRISTPNAANRFA